MTDFGFLQGKSVCVIGGASGLGAGIAARAAQAGAAVTVFDIAPSGIGTYQPVDLRDAASIKAAAAEAVRGGWDVLVGSAGLPAGADPASILQVNYLGQCALLEALIARANPGAGLLSIASIAGREWATQGTAIAQVQGVSGFAEAQAFCAAHDIDGKTAYRLSKAALIQWTRRMAFDHPDNAVRFLAVSPGPVNTPLFQRAAKASPAATAGLLSAAPRVAEPDEIAAAVLGLCRPEFVWLNGINIPLDGGADARFDFLGLDMGFALGSNGGTP